MQDNSATYSSPSRSISLPCARTALHGRLGVGHRAGQRHRWARSRARAAPSLATTTRTRAPAAGSPRRAWTRYRAPPLRLGRGSCLERSPSAGWGGPLAVTPAPSRPTQGTAYAVADLRGAGDCAIAEYPRHAAAWRADGVPVCGEAYQRWFLRRTSVWRELYAGTRRRADQQDLNRMVQGLTSGGMWSPEP